MKLFNKYILAVCFFVLAAIIACSGNLGIAPTYDGTIATATATPVSTVASGTGTVLESDKVITSFGFSSPITATGVITESTHSIAVTVPYGSAVTALVPAIAFAGASITPNANEATDFTTPVTYTVTAADSTTQTYTVTVTVASNTAKEITAFSLASPAATGVITGTNIALTVPYGTSVTALVATFSTTGSSVVVNSTTQVSGTTANDFTIPLEYMVSAGDSSTQTYTVTVTVASNTAKAITAFSFASPAVTGTITGTNIALTVPYGTSVTALVATFTTSGASVAVSSTPQVSATTANNFTSPIEYIVTAADSTAQTYTVTVTVALNPAKAITAFSFASPAATGVITGTNIAITVPYGTAVTALVATFSTTGASVAVNSTTQASGTTANDFTSPVAYVVTAADATTQNYTVTVTFEAITPVTSATLSTTLIAVLGGTFQRDATATNTSTVSAFRMTPKEITRAQFLAIMGTDPSNVAVSTGNTYPVQNLNWYHALAFCNKLSIADGLTPVYTVSGVTFSTLAYASIPTSNNAAWNAASANWNANGYRLPTEMEWRWAAMGGTSGSTPVNGVYTTGYSKLFSGPIAGTLSNYAWTSGDNAGTDTTTHPVGTKLANELGLYDMSGNVYEWFWDWDASYPTGPVTDYTGAASGTSRIMGGGSYYSANWAMALNYRTSASPIGNNESVGFRVVRR